MFGDGEGKITSTPREYANECTANPKEPSKLTFHIFV